MREIREMDLGHYTRKAVTEPERKCGIKLRLLRPTIKASVVDCDCSVSIPDGFVYFGQQSSPRPACLLVPVSIPDGFVYFGQRYQWDCHQLSFAKTRFICVFNNFACLSPDQKFRDQNFILAYRDA